MGTMNVTPDNSGMNLVRNVGMQLKTLVGTFDFDSSYPTNGESFDASNYFPKGVIGIMFFPQDGYVFEYDEDNKKVKAYYADYDATSDGALIEVANETDLSSVKGVRFLALGY